MSIFREFGGKSSYYTKGELDRLQNPEKYDYTQETYDAYSAQVQKKADSRQAAAEVSQDAIPYSYVGRGTGDTNPAFSFAGYGGHTSGGTSGLSGFGGLAGIFGGGSTTETTGGSTGGQDGPERGPGGPARQRHDGGNVQHRAEGGVISLEQGGPVPPQPQPLPPAVQSSQEITDSLMASTNPYGVGRTVEQFQQEEVKTAPDGTVLEVFKTVSQSIGLPPETEAQAKAIFDRNIRIAGLDFATGELLKQFGQVNMSEPNQNLGGPDPRTYMMSGEDAQIQNKQEGGMITSPFANPMKQTMGSIPMNQPDMGPGIDGIFKQLQQQNDNQMNMMMSSPLQVYSQYLNKTYVQPEAEGMVGKVEHFVDLVDQAERAHFGVDESFGFGEFGNPRMQVGTHGPNDGLAAMPPMSVGTFGPNDGLAANHPMAGQSQGIASLPPAFSY